jgi:hypothetical protein
MANWAELESSAPEIASAGRELLKGGDGHAFLSTVRGDQPPRIHPISVRIVNGALYAIMLPSAKLTDLLEDGRYALHSQLDPDAPSEFLVRGRVREVTDRQERDPVAADWPFRPGEEDRLFALDIESALLGERPDANAWPPRYSRWPASGRGTA